jgi:hypothetical protein
MAALTPTLVLVVASPGGEYVEKTFTVAPSSASDTVDLTTYFDNVKFVRTPHITAGADANLLTAHATNSSETITIVTKGADGLAATDWTGASITLSVVGSAYPQ